MLEPAEQVSYVSAGGVNMHWYPLPLASLRPPPQARRPYLPRPKLAPMDDGVGDAGLPKRLASLQLHELKSQRA